MNEELTLPPEYREKIQDESASYPYEIRATPPGKSDDDDESMVLVCREAKGFTVDYWPKGSEKWQAYATVPTLEEAINICKVLVLMGETYFLESK